MLWTIELSRFQVVLLLSKFGRGLKWDFSCRFFGGQSEIAPVIKIFPRSNFLLSLFCNVSEGVVTLIEG